MPFNWQPLPLSWHTVYEAGKLIAMSPDPSNPEVFLGRNDVLLQYSTSDDGMPIIAFKAKPACTPSSVLVKQTTAATLNALSTLLAHEAINPGRMVKVAKRGESSLLVLVSPGIHLANPWM